MTNVVLDALKTRRSCRSYKPDQIKPEELNAGTGSRNMGTDCDGNPGTDHRRSSGCC